MAWTKKKKPHQGRNHYYSICNKLRKEKKINDEFEIMMSDLTLEEIIAVKLELAAKSAQQPLYGVPIWHSLHNIVQDAVIKYAFSATRTKRDAMRFLGLTPKYYSDLQSKFQPDSYFEDGDEREST